jgi:hypothetical protein
MVRCKPLQKERPEGQRLANMRAHVAWRTAHALMPNASRQLARAARKILSACVRQKQAARDHAASVFDMVVAKCAMHKTKLPFARVR